MELLNPTLTVQNTDNGTWIIRMEQDFGAHQHLDFALQVPKSNLSLPQIQYAALEQLHGVIETMLENARKSAHQ